MHGLTRPLAHRVFEALLLATTAVLLIALGMRIAAGIEAGTGSGPETGSGAGAGAAFWWLLPLAGALGILAADFSSGVLHWFCDRFFDEDTPLLGPNLIRPFREHHRDPLGMVRHDWLELHGNSCIPVVAALAAGLVAGPALPSGPVRAAVDLWLLCFSAAAIATNQFHKWAHAPMVSPAVHWLQEHGVILSPARHARHHRAEFDKSYCMTSGLLNPILDRVDFFGRLERGIRGLKTASRE